MEVLFVCTANQCRSPMAEVLFARLARGAAGLVVGSAGLLPGGQPASEGAVEVMAERGLDLSGHRSRTVDADLLDRADLVVAMAREHLRHVAITRRDAFGRTFTLKEAVRRGRRVGPRQPGEAVSAWAVRLAEGRVTRDLLGDDPTDDVADPIGQPVSIYRATALELEALVQTLVGLVRPE